MWPRNMDWQHDLPTPHRAHAQASVPHIRFHDLQHGRPARLLEAGVNPKVVAERPGHIDISLILSRYSHVLASTQRAAVDAFERVATERQVPAMSV